MELTKKVKIEEEGFFEIGDEIEISFEVDIDDLEGAVSELTNREAESLFEEINDYYSFGEKLDATYDQTKKYIEESATESELRELFIIMKNKNKDVNFDDDHILIVDNLHDVMKLELFKEVWKNLTYEQLKNRLIKREKRNI